MLVSPLLQMKVHGEREREERQKEKDELLSLVAFGFSRGLINFGSVCCWTCKDQVC